MNDLDDLRRTLEQHAGDVSVTDATTRRTAVGRRIGAARRRRRAGAVAAVAAVVATATGVALLPGGGESAGPAPAGQSVFGLDVPAALGSLGYRYELDRVESSDGSDRATLELTASASPRLVSWATQGDDQRVTVSGYGDPTRHDSADFDDWVLIPAGEDASLTVRARSGDVAAAVYDLDEDLSQRPAGITEGTTTFRQEADGMTLVGATLGEPGESELTLTADDVPAGRTTVFAFCVDAPDGAGLDYVVEGRDGSVTSSNVCRDRLPVDVVGSASGQPIPVRPGQDVTIRLADSDFDLIDDDDVVLGLAVYVEPTAVAGPDVHEAYGHRWTEVDDVAAPRGRDRWSTTVPDLADGQQLLAVTTFDLEGDGRAEVLLTAGDASPYAFSGPGTSSTATLVTPGQRIRYEVLSGELAAGTGVTVAYYERAD